MSGKPQVLSATYFEAYDYSYMLAKPNARVMDAEATAKSELKRKLDFDDAEFCGIKVMKQGAEPRTVEVDRTAKMKPEYVLQFKNGADMSAKRQQDLTFKKIVLKRLLRSFSSRVFSRLISGKAREEQPPKTGMQNFISTQSNCEKVEKFLDAVGCKEFTPLDFASAADKDYGDRNNDEHNNTDDALDEDAEELMEVGAVELLKSKLPLPCILVEHFSLVKEHLFR